MEEWTVYQQQSQKEQDKVCVVITTIGVIVWLVLCQILQR